MIVFGRASWGVSMSNLIKTGFSILALTAAIVPAAAADMPVKAPSVAVATVYNWVGFYVGVHGGGGWGKKESSTPAMAGHPMPPARLASRWLRGAAQSPATKSRSQIPLWIIDFPQGECRV